MKIPKALKICLFATLILIIILIAVILILYFTILKPKQPKITTQQVTFKDFNIYLNPFHIDVTLGLIVTVNNPNYASFRYDNTTAYVTYRGTHAAQAPIAENAIRARGEEDISADVYVHVDDLVSNGGFAADFAAGCLNFTSTTTYRGEAKVMGLVKMKATIYSACEISVFVDTQNSSFVCRSKVKY